MRLTFRTGVVYNSAIPGKYLSHHVKIKRIQKNLTSFYLTPIVPDSSVRKLFVVETHAKEKRISAQKCR